MDHTLFCDGNCWGCGYHRQLVDDKFVIKNIQLPDDKDLNNAAQKFSIDVTGNTNFSVMRSFKVGATWQRQKDEEEIKRAYLKGRADAWNEITSE